MQANTNRIWKARMQSAFTDAIRVAQNELSVEIAGFPDDILEVQRLRFRIYCEERGFEPGKDGLEQDAFDPAARHVLVRSRVTGVVLGTVRVVFSTDEKGLNGFPMQRVCEPWVLASMPLSFTGEISRFALTRDREGVSPAAAALMRLSLVRGLVQVSAENKLTHWCAIMERTLLRLLRATAIHFVPVGPTVRYHGIRQPAVCHINGMLDRMKLEQPSLWNYITDGGVLWSKSEVEHRRFR